VAQTFYAQLLTPEGALFEGDVIGVNVPGTSGSFEMLHNHAPLVSSLGIGKIEIEQENSSPLVYAVSGGFVEINDNHCTILAEKAEEAGSIDASEAAKERDELQAKLKETTHNREEAEHELAIAQNRVKIAG
jgi:F-type H+-transporting ATPase subunit epsilon